MTRRGGQYVAYLLPDPGIPVGGTKGASVHVESLCAAMARAGTYVVLYAANVVGPLRAPGSDTVRVVPLDVGKVHSGPGGDRSRVAAAASFFEQVGRHLDGRRPDWVHERLSLFAGGGSAVCAARGLSRVVEINAPVSSERLRHFGLELVAEAERAERDALREARVLAVSQPLAEWALAGGASEALVVPNGADTDGLDPALWASRRGGIRRRLGLAGRVVVGFAGSLKPWHGIEVLFDAVARASRRHPLGLLVVGDGPGRSAAELAVRALPASVTPVLTGSVPFSEIPRYLAAMDISVAPYLPAEDFYFSPLKVAEAMAAGLAVVASDFPPIRELLGSTGVLVAPGNADSLASAIESLVLDSTSRAHLGTSARIRAVRHLGWTAVAARALAFGEGREGRAGRAEREGRLQLLGAPRAR